MKYIIIKILIFFCFIYLIMDLYLKKYLKYKEKYLNLKYGGIGVINNILIIPHAGKKYSGDARTKAFENINKNINQVFYIAALHNMDLANKLFENKIFVDNDNLGIFNDSIFIKNKNNLSNKQKEIIEEEHSFVWVKDEINNYFNNPNITIIYPNEICSLEMIVISLQSQINNINSLIIGTSDFIHYGKRFGLTNWDNPQQEKIIKEGEFIFNICQKDLSKVINQYTDNKYLCCGFISIKTILLIAKETDREGDVVDYYDSNQSEFRDIRRYSLNDEVDNFVSYASIIFSNKNKITLSDNDIRLGFGAVRSIINYSIDKNVFNNVNPNNFIPLFTRWWDLKNGIFVGTTFKDDTNSSRGNYQKVGNSAAINLFNASKYCYNDSIERWGKPITKDCLLNKYKIEILDDEKSWEKIKSINLNSNHYKLGLYLTVNFNNTKYSATYLPGVWEEHFTNDPNKVLEKLTLKATSDERHDWYNDKDSTVKLYSSTKYFSNNIFNDI